MSTTWLLDLLFPRRCAGCGEFGPGEWLCPDCERMVDPLAPGCPTCNGDVGLTGTCARCREPLPELDWLVAAAPYRGPAVGLVRSLKYQGRRVLVDKMAELMAGRLPYPRGEVLVPIPLHRRRQARRGFNQAALLARELAALTGRPTAQCLVRQRNTPTQTRLSLTQRWGNLAEAFAARGPVPDRVLLVDDVCTSGATLSLAAQVLRAAGSREVGAVTFARG